jgi:nitronate monooxygenase
MWPRNELLRRIGIEHPIIQAPMAGGPSTPALVAAVSSAGALGSFAGGYLPPEAIRSAIQEIRRLADRPFGVNLFVPEPARRSPTDDEVARAQEALRPFRDELGIPVPPRIPPPPPFEAQLGVVLEERVPVFSFTFGTLPEADVKRLHERGILVMGTATTPREAAALERAGVDAVVAQGSEAGGHRGTFAGPPEEGLIGTMALVPQVVDRVGVPVVAAGGIMDGRGLVAALALGASAVQMGTAFLASAESGAHPRHKEAVLTRSDEDRTALTRAFTGRLARGVRNRFMVEMEQRGAILPYPHQGLLTQDIRQASARDGRDEFLSLWAGQAAPLATGKGAREIVDDLVAQARESLRRLR